MEKLCCIIPALIREYGSIDIYRALDMLFGFGFCHTTLTGAYTGANGPKHQKSHTNDNIENSNQE